MIAMVDDESKGDKEQQWLVHVNHDEPSLNYCLSAPLFSNRLCSTELSLFDCHGPEINIYESLAIDSHGFLMHND